VVSHELPQIFAIADNSIFLDPETKSMIAYGDPKELVREGIGGPKVREFLTRGDVTAPAQKTMSPSHRCRA
jgi:phospholipid/cholesterol/gamma-HCH transport system ATP-binding protein